MTIANSIHDKTFKTAMADLRVAREFFETYLPDNILSMIDLNTLKLSPNSYIDEDLNSLASDVLYRARLKDEKIGYIYVLCEHQSKVDSLMSFRIWSYIMRIWADIIKQTRSKRLPLIFPLVFYHGRIPYNGCRNLRELIEGPADIVNEILFKDFYLIDTHNIQDEDLRNQHWTGILTFMFKHVYERDIWPHMQALISMIQKVEGEDDAVHYINSLLKYWLVAAEIRKDPKDFIEAIQKEVSKPVKEEFMTMAEQLIQEGVVKGISQGERMFLIRQLERKFTSIPDLYQEKIKEANSDQLLNWSFRFPEVSSLDEVFEC